MTNKEKTLSSLKAAIASIQASSPSVLSVNAETEKQTVVKEKLSDLLKSQEDSPEKKAKKYALDCLIRREHGSVELLRKMKAKGYEEEVCETVLQDLIDEGSQSDMRFAIAMVAHGAFKGQGPVKIRQDIQQKGLTGEIVSLAFEEAEIDWHGLAMEVRIKKYGPCMPEVWKDKAKQMRFLQQRGFEMDQIQFAF